MTAAEYILARCIPVPFCGCWMWLPTANIQGYGQADSADTTTEESE